jgi:hypothetical protein
MSLESATRKEIIDLDLESAGQDVSDKRQVIEEFFIPQSAYRNGVLAPSQTNEIVELTERLVA